MGFPAMSLEIDCLLSRSIGSGQADQTIARSIKGPAAMLLRTNFCSLHFVHAKAEITVGAGRAQKTVVPAVHVRNERRAKFLCAVGPDIGAPFFRAERSDPWQKNEQCDYAKRVWQS